MEPRGTPTKPDSDVYTALIVIATLFLMTATIFMWVRSQELYGSWLPLGGGG